jgi:hypothetical protein
VPAHTQHLNIKNFIKKKTTKNKQTNKQHVIEKY